MLFLPKVLHTCQMYRFDIQKMLKLHQDIAIFMEIKIF